METFEFDGWRFRIKETRNRNGETIKTITVVATVANLDVTSFINAVTQLQASLGGTN